MNRFTVVPAQDEFHVVEIAGNGDWEAIAWFETEAEAREWLRRNQRLLELPEIPVDFRTAAS